MRHSIGPLPLSRTCLNVRLPAKDPQVSLAIGPGRTQQLTIRAAD